MQKICMPLPCSVFMRTAPYGPFDWLRHSADTFPVLFCCLSFEHRPDKEAGADTKGAGVEVS